MSFLEIDNPEYLLKVLNILQGTHYIAILSQDPRQEKYVRGWLERVEIRKSKRRNLGTERMKHDEQPGN